MSWRRERSERMYENKCGLHVHIFLYCFESNDTVMDWTTAKKDTLKELSTLPEYTDDLILAQYKALLDEIEKPDISQMQPALRAITMQDKFPQFSIAYSGLFNRACRRTPLPYDVVKEMVHTASRQKSGEVSEAKSRGCVMDIAEGYRRSQLSHSSS